MSLCRTTGQLLTRCMTSSTTWCGLPNTERRCCTDRWQKGFVIFCERYVRQKMWRLSKARSRKIMSISSSPCLPSSLSPSSCSLSKARPPISSFQSTKNSRDNSGAVIYGGGDISLLPRAMSPMKLSWNISPRRTSKRMTVISKLPHNGEAALADSGYQHIGSFKPTGFSRWWFSFLLSSGTPSCF